MLENHHLRVLEQEWEKWWMQLEARLQLPAAPAHIAEASFYGDPSTGATVTA